MNKYKVIFTGRQSGSDGITYEVTRHYQSENLQAALTWLHTYYHHISGLQIWENGKPVSSEDIKLNDTPAPRIKIHSLAVTAKEWFDSSAGNSYFSAQIQVNEETLYLRFQYGYESAYIQATHQALLNAGYEVGAGWNVEKWANEQGINATFQKIENCLQRDVKAWGKGTEY